MRNEIERRPALVLLLGLVAGLTSSAFLPNLFLFLAGVCLLRVLSCRVWTSFGFLVGALLAPVLPNSAPPADSVRTFEAVVTSVPTLNGSNGSSFLAVSPDGRQWEVRCDKGVPVLGDEVSLQGTPDPVPALLRRTYAGRGVYGIFNLPEVTVVHEASGPALWANRWRSSFVSYCRANLPGEDAAVFSSLAFDVSTGLSRRTRDDLDHSGAQHLLMASGLHLLVFAWFLEFLLCRAPFPYLLRRVLIVGLVFLYALAAGFHPGAFRAAFATLMRDGAVVTAREYDPISALALAGCIYLVWRPNGVYGAGFQMSMVLGFTLSVVRSSTSGMKFWPRLGWGALSGWLASVPLTANLFGIVSLVAVPTNLLAAVLVPICLLGMLCAHAVSFISEAVSAIFIAASTPFAHLLEQTIRFFGELPFWGSEVPSFSGYWLVPVYLWALFLWKPRQRRVN